MDRKGFSKESDLEVFQILLKFRSIYTASLTPAYYRYQMFYEPIFFTFLHWLLSNVSLYSRIKGGSLMEAVVVMSEYNGNMIKDLVSRK